MDADMDFVESHLGAVFRTVSSQERQRRPTRAVAISRGYATTITDLWDAVTNVERIPRWFLPVSGQLELGGRYQLEGNAGGVITACEAPTRLALTWEFAEDVSWVDVGFSNDGTGSRLTLTHSAHLSEHWATYGPGAVGVGWELGLMGLAIHLAQPPKPKLDEAAFAASPDGIAFAQGSSEGWRAAAVAAGTAPDTARAAADRTTAFYTGEPAPAS